MKNSLFDNIYAFLCFFDGKYNLLGNTLNNKIHKDLFIQYIANSNSYTKYTHQNTKTHYDALSFKFYDKKQNRIYLTCDKHVPIESDIFCFQITFYFKNKKIYEKYIYTSKKVYMKNKIVVDNGSNKNTTGFDEFIITYKDINNNNYNNLDYGLFYKDGLVLSGEKIKNIFNIRNLDINTLSFYGEDLVLFKLKFN